MLINISGIKGEEGTGYEASENKGPFECGNCEYFRGSNSTCGQKVMVAKAKQSDLIDGRRSVDPKGCCEFVDRLGEKKDDGKFDIKRATWI